MDPIQGESSSSMTGKYMHPVINDNTQNSDPWQRNYYAPPPLKPLVPRSYPLYDVRPHTTSSEYSPVELLQSHGFGIVNHHSSFVDRLDHGISENAVAKLYHPEIIDLVQKTIGAKQVFILGSVFRQGTRTPAEYQYPAGRKPISQAQSLPQDQRIDTKPEHQPHMLAAQSNLSLAAPIRIPHLDFTPLGARQTIRLQRPDIAEAARDVIDAEGGICEAHQVDALTKEADPIIARLYDGPRYATYSIWRPLKPVGRDPITLAPRMEVPRSDGELIHWQYENKQPGPTELKGDYLKEHAMLGVRQKDKPATENDLLKWYYVSNQSPDDVLFIQLFDSASLGKGAQAGAPWHASPEIGDAATSDGPRESIDIRVLVFW